ncbi:MAG: hypothetical protein R3A13_07430 [Bdellovibrionota bacterium]
MCSTPTPTPTMTPTPTPTPCHGHYCPTPTPTPTVTPTPTPCMPDYCGRPCGHPNYGSHVCSTPTPTPTPCKPDYCKRPCGHPNYGSHVCSTPTPTPTPCIPDECGYCQNDPNHGVGKNECDSCPGPQQIVPDECGICGGPGKDTCGRCQNDPDYNNPDCGCPNGQTMDECGICGGTGTDECKRCPTDPDFGKPCTDCVQGFDRCGVCGGNGSSCCEGTDVTSILLSLDGSTHKIRNQTMTYTRRIKRFAQRKLGGLSRAQAKKVSGFIEASNSGQVETWSTIWSIGQIQTLCDSNAQGCTTVSNTGTLAEINSSAQNQLAVVQNAFNFYRKLVGNKRKRMAGPLNAAKKVANQIQGLTAQLPESQDICQ